MSMNREVAEKELQKKLDSAHIKPPKKFGPKGDYIESWHAISEANRIFGHFEWSATNARLECVSEKSRKIGKEQKDGWGVTYVCTREIVVDGVIRHGTGAGHGYDVDLGLAHESAVKEAESDAEKRALRTFGNPFGLALYDKSRDNVEDASDAYVRVALAVIDHNLTNRHGATQWWADEAGHRRENGLSQDQVDQLKDALLKKFPKEQEAA